MVLATGGPPHDMQVVYDINRAGVAQKLKIVAALWTGNCGLCCFSWDVG